MRKLLTVASAPLLALVMILAALGFLPQGAAAIGEPPAGTVNSVQNYEMYAATAIITDGTYYGDAQHWQQWNSVDVFVTVDVTGTATLTVTPQVSADGTNFADAYHTYLTWTDDATATVTEADYQVVMTADGTEYIRLPMAGRYMRAKVEVSGDLTPTITAVTRNN